MSAPGFAAVRVEADAGVGIGRLILARPERRNALNVAALREVVAAAAWFDERPGVRVVIVAGDGRSFCSGVDLREAPAAAIDPASGLGWEERREIADLGRRMADAVEGMRAVTVAALHGHVVGGGVVLAAACDLRVAAAGTVFLIPEVDLGIPLAWGGIPRLVREIGPALTKELVMTCRPFDAAEAQAAGFVNRVVPAGELGVAVEELAATLAEKPPVPLAVTKRHVQAVAAGTAGSFADADALLAALSSPESREAAVRYLEQTFGARE